MTRNPSSRERIGTRSKAINLSVGGRNVASTSLFDDIRKTILAIKVRVGSMDDLFDDLAALVLDGLRERLKEAGYGEWAPLAPFTIEQRELRGTAQGAIFPDQPILNETGALFEGIKVLYKSKQTLNIGGTVSYQALHEEGYVTADGKEVPARPLMSLDPPLLRDIHYFLQNFMEGLLESDPNRARFKKSNRGRSVFSPSGDFGSTTGQVDMFAGEVPF